MGLNNVDSPGLLGDEFWPNPPKEGLKGHIRIADIKEVVQGENIQASDITVEEEVTAEANDDVDGSDGNQLEMMDSDRFVQTLEVAGVTPTT